MKVRPGKASPADVGTGLRERGQDLPDRSGHLPHAAVTSLEGAPGGGVGGERE